MINNPIIYNDEIFKDITLSEIQPIYAVSNYGSVLNKVTGEYLSVHDTKGYLRVGLRKINGGNKQFLVHRLVMLTFHYNPNHNNLEVNHIHGEKYDNHDLNLEWVTGKENIEHAIRTGLTNNRGENSSISILTNDEVIKICELLQEGKSVNEILNIVPLSNTKDPGRCVRSIKERKSWRHISKDYKFSNRNDRDMFTESEVENICEMLQNGFGYKDILVSLGFNIANMNTTQLQNMCDIISNIRVGRYYSNISKKYNVKSETKQRYDQIMSYDDIKYICSCLEVGMNAPAILKSFNITKETVGVVEYERYRHFVSRIKTKKIFVNISSNYKF